MILTRLISQTTPVCATIQTGLTGADPPTPAIIPQSATGLAERNNKLHVNK